MKRFPVVVNSQDLTPVNMPRDLCQRMRETVEMFTYPAFRSSGQRGCVLYAQRNIWFLFNLEWIPNP